MCHLVALAIEESWAGTWGVLGSPCPALVRQLHPWAPLCTIPTACKNCPGAVVHLAAQVYDTHCLPRWTPGSLGWELHSWKSKKSAAKADGMMIPGQCRSPGQAVHAGCCGPPNFPSPGAVNVSALCSRPRWSICFQSSITSRRVQGWLQTPFPCVLVPIPGRFLCLENRTTSQSMGAELQHQ